MAVLEIVALVAALLSIFIGGGAIWLSLHFFKMSHGINRETEKEILKIDSKIEMLQELFNKFYSGTFSMMERTVSGMSDHLFSSSERIEEDNRKIEKKADKEVSKIKNEFDKALLSLLKEQQIKDDKIQDLNYTIRRMSGDLVKESKNIYDSTKKVTLESLLEEVLTFIGNKKKGNIKLRDVVETLINKYDRRYSLHNILDVLRAMEEKGLIKLFGTAQMMTIKLIKNRFKGLNNRQ